MLERGRARFTWWQCGDEPATSYTGNHWPTPRVFSSLASRITIKRQRHNLKEQPEMSEKKITNALQPRHHVLSILVWRMGSQLIILRFLILWIGGCRYLKLIENYTFLARKLEGLPKGQSLFVYWVHVWDHGEEIHCSWIFLHKPTQTLVSLQAANTYRQKNAKDLKTELTMEPLHRRQDWTWGPN